KARSRGDSLYFSQWKPPLFAMKLTSRFALRNGRSGTRWLNSTVFGIGMASLFSDLSHETATSLMPALIASMGAAAGALGTIEAVSDGFSSIAKLYGGWWTDRLHRRKPLCAAGYGVMAGAS